MEEQDEVHLDLFVWYYLRLFSIPVPIISLVKLKFNSENKIVYHSDAWFHTPILSSDDGWIGYFWQVYTIKL